MGNTGTAERPANCVRFGRRMPPPSMFEAQLFRCLMIRGSTLLSNNSTNADSPIKVPKPTL